MPAGSTQNKLWTLDFGRLDIFCVTQKREQREERAQNVFAFGNPRDRFDVQRMPREQRGDEGAWPDFSRQPEQKREKQRRVHRVKQDADEVVCAGIQAEELAVGHVRNPGERMPVAGVKGGERPAEVRPVQAVFDERIFGDVVGVVIVDKRV